MCWSLRDLWITSKCKDTKSQSFAKWAQIAKRTLCRRFQLTESHWAEADAVCEDARFHKSQVKVGTKCLVLHLLLWSGSVENEVAQRIPLHLLTGFMGFCFKNMGLHVYQCVSRLWPDDFEHAAMIADGQVHCLKNIHRVGLIDAKLELSTVLLDLWVAKWNDTLLQHIVEEIASAIEDALPSSGMSPSCLEFLPAIVAQRQGNSRRPLDKDVVSQMRDLQSGSLIRTSRALNRVARGLNLGLHAGDDRNEILDCTVTALASRRAFSKCTAFSLAADAERFGGKHWLAAVLGANLENLFSFANPVVLVI